ncbi:hypothetical protein BDQ17DRAFT_1027083 [Cyathus striatus]|nr:hypothetical protein BDQ17DRAFT_1027083 [Cyathus striatus]
MLVDHSLKSLSPFNQVHPPTLSSSSCCSLYSFQIHSAIFWGHFHRDLVKAVLTASLASCCMLLGGMFIVILQIPTMTMCCWLSSTFIWDSTLGQVRGAIVLDTLSSLVLEFLACFDSLCESSDANVDSPNTSYYTTPCFSEGSYITTNAYTATSLAYMAESPSLPPPTTMER